MLFGLPGLFTFLRVLLSRDNFVRLLSSGADSSVAQRNTVIEGKRREALPREKEPPASKSSNGKGNSLLPTSCFVEEISFDPLQVRWTWSHTLHTIMAQGNFPLTGWFLSVQDDSSCCVLRSSSAAFSQFTSSARFKGSKISPWATKIFDTRRSDHEKSYALSTSINRNWYGCWWELTQHGPS